MSGALTGDDCTLDQGSFFDSWTFPGRIGGKVVITMAAGFDTFLSLYKPNGELAASNDDFGGTTNSQITFTLDMNGTWLIRASSHDAFVTGDYSLELTCTVAPPLDVCAAGPNTLCLNSDRFQVEVNWRVPTQGTSGDGRAVPLTSDTGYFWFFSSNNVELVVKAVDGRPVNGYFWVFYGALSDVEYTITVTDTVTGEVKTYANPSGRLASVADVTAFSGGAGVATARMSPESIAEVVRLESEKLSRLVAGSSSVVCLSDAITLCLNGGRFQVRVIFSAPSLGISNAPARAVPLTSDTGYFWFFSSNNVELVIKAVDGRPANGYFWVFYGALSDVEFTITVTDTVTGAAKTYTNPPGRLASVADVAAF
ncbi:MAG TPA: hypothetical protein VGQ75_04185 [Thermoanaerobaculia bacterium]|nr:hypothetical protein [Thermoanaerobaculia bacterium]